MPEGTADRSHVVDLMEMEFTPFSAYFQLDSAIYGDRLVDRWEIYGFVTVNMLAF